MLRRPLAPAVALLVLLLTACTPPTVIPPAAPPSDEAPLFESDEEALAAATEAYEEFLAALDKVLSDPKDPDHALAELASDEVLEEAREAVANFRERGWRIVGARQVRLSTLQQATQTSEFAEVTIYVCESTEGVDVVDEAGVSQVSEQREVLTAFEVNVIFDDEASGITESRNLWVTEDVCDS